MENNSEIEVVQANGLSSNETEINEDEHLCNSSEIETVQENNLSSNETEIREDKQQYLCGNVVISLEDMLKQLTCVNSNGTICRVPKPLREMNPKAYDPQLISIGPFHHHTRNDLMATELYKLRALVAFLYRINYKMDSLEDAMKIGSLEDLLKTELLTFLVENAHFWVKETRNCYVEPINMNDEKFLIMMLVDACFILEFFILYYRTYNESGQDNDVYVSLLHPEISLDILVDLLKLENQVPFFLLRHLFDLLPEDSIPKSSFTDLACFALCNGSLLDEYKDHFGSYSDIEPKHFVDFLRLYFVPLPLDDRQIRKQHRKDGENKNNLSNFKRRYIPAYWKKQAKENSKQKRWTPPSITEIWEAGVIIKKAENSQRITNISFKNGVMEIPPLLISDEFETSLRNLIAFEHFPIGKENKYVTQFVLFLDDLISTAKDVSLLVEAGIIVNEIGGSDKEVANMFNNLCKFVTYSSSSHYDSISKDLREHCNGRWNKAKASLKHNYFNTPWAFISFFAATFLLLLTLLQTIFSVIFAFP